MAIFYSTNLKSPKVDFRTALLTGQAPDKGLYTLETIPKFSQQDIDTMKDMSYPEIASIVIEKVIGDEIESDEIKNIAEDAYKFEVPLQKVSRNNYIMHLDQGPTASFKDFAALIMARLMQHFTKEKITILTATSGDTGGAVANAFYGLGNIKVVVLFPEKEVSDRQRKQMTTLGKNVTAIAIDGKFDDCQAMVKQAFADATLNNLTSANSINFGRLLPQSVFYFYAYSRLKNKLFSVPSGNFGDLMGGLLAKRMGLPVNFVTAVNENDEFVNFLRYENYQKIVPSINCISNAMNVGHPSNLVRLIALYGGQMDETGLIHKMPDLNAIKKEIFAVSITDQETRETIKNVYSDFNVIIEPHTAVGWLGIEKYREETSYKSIGVCLGTAHPAKFPDEIIALTGKNPEPPQSLSNLDNLEEHMIQMKAEYSELKEFLAR